MRKSLLAFMLSFCLLLSFIPSAHALDDQLTIYLPCFTPGSAQKEFCSYASELVQNAGFDIRFEVFKPFISDNENEYKKFMTENSYSDNCAFVAPVSVLEELYNEGIFCEVIPTDYTAPQTNRLALLIKTELLEKYGQPIRDAASLEDWLYSRPNDAWDIPLAAAPALYDRLYGGYTWLNLFLPEEGYFALNSEFSNPNACDFYSSLDEYDFYSFFDLPVLANCANRYLDWMELNLIEHYNPDSIADISEYDAVLVNTKDFLYPLMMARNDALASLDLTEYSMQILYTEDLPATSRENTPSSQYGICAGDGAQEEIRYFMDWLSSPEGYLTLLYGKEGIDYSMEDDYMVPNVSSDYRLWDHRILFLRDDLEPELTNDNLPVNFLEEMELLKDAPEPLYDKESFELVEQEMIDMEYMPILAKMANDNHNVCEELYAKIYLPTIRDMAAMWIENAHAYGVHYEPAIGLLYEYLAQ